GGLNFDSLSQRIHPAESRVRRLAAETPAAFVAFDLLALDDVSHLDAPFTERRRLLEEAVGGAAVAPSTGVATPPDAGIPAGSVYITPASTDRGHADEWFNRFEGAGLDGVVAKRSDDAYVPGKRILVKVKHERTAECVVAG